MDDVRLLVERLISLVRGSRGSVVCFTVRKIFGRGDLRHGLAARVRAGRLLAKLEALGLVKCRRCRSGTVRLCCVEKEMTMWRALEREECVAAVVELLQVLYRVGKRDFETRARLYIEKIRKCVDNM